MALQYWQQVKAAIKQGNADEVVALIGDDPSNLTMETVFGGWLHLAASYGQLEIVKRFLAMGIDINARGGVSKETALSDAASKGHIEIVKLLISRGAELDVSEPERNPLFGAVYGGHTDVAKVLLESGIDPQVTYVLDGGRRKNALSYAIQAGRTEIADLLRAAGCTPPVQDPEEHADSHQQIITSMSQEFGEVDSLALQEIVAVDEQVRVSIHVIRPNERHHCVTLFTTGMSDKPMTVPDENEEYQYAELLMHLPASWPVPDKSDASDEAWWPIQWLRQLAYYPHQADTWLGGRHTIVSNDEPPSAFAKNTQFSCLLLVADFAGWSPVELDDTRTVHFYTVIPIYAEERDYERQYSLTDLLQRFDEHGVMAIADSSRVNVARIR